MGRQRKIEKDKHAELKKRFAAEFSNDNPPVIVEHISQLKRAMPAIIQAKGRVEIKDWGRDMKQISQALSTAFAIIINTVPPSWRDTLQKGADKNRDTANQFALNIAPIIADIRAQGMETYQEVADELTNRGVKTYRASKNPDIESKWYPKTVQNLEDRIAFLQDKLTP